MRGRLAAAFVLVALAGCRRERPMPEPAPAGLPVAFEPAVLDLGTLVAGTVAEGAVTLRNMTDHDIQLTALDVPCGCTTARLEIPQTLAARQVLEVPIRLDLSTIADGGLPVGAAGPSVVDRTVSVRTAQGGASLTVRASVAAGLRLDPTRLEFEPIGVGATAAARIAILPVAGQPQVELLDARSDDPLLQGAVTEGAAAANVTWGPFTDQGLRESWLVLRTTSAETPEVRVPARVQVVGRVLLSPTRIDVRDASLVHPVVQAVSLRRPDGGPLRILGVQVDSTRVKATLREQGAGPVRTLQVVVAVPAPPRSVDATLIIDTDVEGAGRLELPIHVSARP